MVDLESRKLIDMIESREQGDVATWLKTYPNIQIVSRDGSRVYANAISDAHPNAIHISDRFHLVKNLNDYARLALQKLFQGRVAIPITDETKRRRMVMTLGTVAEQASLVKYLHRNGHSQSDIIQITAASERMVKKYLDMPDNTMQMVGLLGMPVNADKDICQQQSQNQNQHQHQNQNQKQGQQYPAAEAATTKHTSRGLLHIEAVKKLQKRADMVRDLKSQGFNISEISRQTGFTYNTIRNYLYEHFSPINAHYGKQREGKLEPFRSEVLQLKSEGLKYREIHAIIKEKGYKGSQDAIRGFISKERRIYRDLSAGVRSGTGMAVSDDINASTRNDTDSKVENSKFNHYEFIDKKWLIRLLYKPMTKVKGITTEQLAYVFSAYPQYKNILDIVADFKILLKSKNPEALQIWIEKASSFEIPELNSFVGGIKLDIDAVTNAIIYDHSNGIAEGTINKIKVIKRIMYGRCRFSLLKNKCIMLSKFN